MKRTLSLQANVVVMSLIIGLFCASPAYALISLEWRPIDQTVSVDDVFGIGLYAVSTAPTESFVSMDVIFTWDSDYLEILGLDDTGAVTLASSSFPATDDYDLNENGVNPPADGDGLFRGTVANLSEPVNATPGGILVTTFEARALDVIGETFFSISATGGTDGVTRVLESTDPDIDITGMLGSATITIVPEPATLLLLGLGGLVLRRRR